jgi:microcystin-dependent protein
MSDVPLIANPLLPTVPDQPQGMEDEEVQKAFDSIWKWMKDLTFQLKVLFGSPQASNNAITIPLVQAGTIVEFGGSSSSIPSGYLFCDGTAVSRTQYPALFAAIGTFNGSGDGSTTFNLPDKRGRVTVGSGAGSGLTNRTVGQTGGEENHVLATSEIPALSVSDPGHTHTPSDPGHGHVGPDHQQGIAVAAGSSGPFLQTSGGSGPSYQVNSNTTGITIPSRTTGISVSGGGTSHNNMQPFHVGTYMIKF